MHGLRTRQGSKTYSHQTTWRKGHTYTTYTVTCYDYEHMDKLSPRSWKGRVIGYTDSFGPYWIRTSEGTSKLAKNPVSIQLSESAEGSSSEEDKELIGNEPSGEPALKSPPQKPYHTSLGNASLPGCSSSPGCASAPTQSLSDSSWRVSRL